MNSAKPGVESADKATPFLSDVTALRQRARQHIEQGAVTPSYSANKQTVLNRLNEALATELVCVLRYRRHYFMAEGLLAEVIKQEFLTHAPSSRAHLGGRGGACRGTRQHAEEPCRLSANAAGRTTHRHGMSVAVFD